MHTQFANIVNRLKALEKKLSNEELMNKMHMSLIKTLKDKAIAIEEIKNLSK